MPEYDTITLDQRRHYSIVKVNGHTYQGEETTNKKSAESAAALVALNAINK